MADILSEICESKRCELDIAARKMPIKELRARALDVAPSALDMAGALAASRSGIIAEFKRRSPSKGWIHQNVGPLDVVPGYAAGGASALSILTDMPYFGGVMTYIEAVRPLVNIPILRKDFILSERQLLEARLIGADAVLLIASCLSLGEFDDLLGRAHELGLQVLLEVHTEAELEYMRGGVDMLGVNNRNLGTFHTDVQNSFRIAAAMREAVKGIVGGGGLAYGGDGSGAAGPDAGVGSGAGLAGDVVAGGAPVLVSESGISSVDTVRALRQEGFRGFLMGENFMKNEDPSAALAAFVADLER